MKHEFDFINGVFRDVLLPSFVTHTEHVWKLHQAKQV